MTAPRRPIGARWRRYRASRRAARIMPAVTAMINLGLLIQLFLVLQDAFVRQPAARVTLPRAGFLDGAPLKARVVTLTQEGLVFFNDERLPIETLANAFQTAADDQQVTAVTIEADAGVPYGTVVRVMNMAVAAGLQEIRLATRPTFGEEVMP